MGLSIEICATCLQSHTEEIYTKVSGAVEPTNECAANRNQPTRTHRWSPASFMSRPPKEIMTATLGSREPPPPPAATDSILNTFPYVT